MGQTIVPRSTKEEGRRLFVSPHQPTGSSSDENTRSSKRARRTMIAASTLFRQRSQSRGSGEGARRGAREALHQRQKKTARMIQHKPCCLSGYNQEAGQSNRRSPRRGINRGRTILRWSVGCGDYRSWYAK